jgi:type VI secretion system protein ImpK
MTPHFAQAVDPVFLHVLRLLERLDAGENPDPAEAKRGIDLTLQQAAMALAHSAQAKEWEIAKYGLVVWIDDLLINSQWEHYQEWADNYCLEAELYGIRLADEKFYSEAETAKKLASSDALEVFYICVVLGFRGMYRDAFSAERAAAALGLPATLEAWTQETGKSIRAGKGMPSIVGNARPGEGVPALRGYTSLCWTLLASAVTTLVGTLLIIKLWPKD